MKCQKNKNINLNREITFIKKKTGKGERGHYNKKKTLNKKQNKKDKQIQTTQTHDERLPSPL